MNQKSIAILIMLAFIGMGMAFLFVGLMVIGTGTSHEDVWIYQSSPKKLLEIPMLSEKQRQMAIEIAKQNETVKQYSKRIYCFGLRDNRYCFVRAWHQRFLSAPRGLPDARKGEG